MGELEFSEISANLNNSDFMYLSSVFSVLGLTARVQNMSTFRGDN